MRGRGRHNLIPFTFFLAVLEKILGNQMFGKRLFDCKKLDYLSTESGAILGWPARAFLLALLFRHKVLYYQYIL
jgi:hypothetical protein